MPHTFTYPIVTPIRRPTGETPTPPPAPGTGATSTGRPAAA